jgi:glutamyl-tRNA reductase
MRCNKNESIEAWTERVREYELTRALHQLSIGKHLEVVSSEMAKRITDKLNHYVIIRIKLNS